MTSPTSRNASATARIPGAQHAVIVRHQDQRPFVIALSLIRRGRGLQSLLSRVCRGDWI